MIRQRLNEAGRSSTSCCKIAHDSIDIPLEIDTVEKVWERVLQLTNSNIKTEANLYAVVKGEATKLTDDILKLCDDAFLVPQDLEELVYAYQGKIALRMTLINVQENQHRLSQHRMERPMASNYIYNPFEGRVVTINNFFSDSVSTLSSHLGVRIGAVRDVELLIPSHWFIQFN
eukprot:m.293407 g.293407  ORF g.293407 m.293407 type:complete len:174 (-) comp21979_c0_seq1:107-628(-)